MHEYNKVPSYIDYFSTSGEEIGTWVHNPPNLTYMSYSSEMLSFIHKVYQPDLIDAEYLPYLESHLPHEINLADYIEIADFRLIRAILTYFVRQERFSDGLWQDTVW
jgi:hypothetical protein